MPLRQLFLALLLTLDLTDAAEAKTVLNRGNQGEPTSLDHHKSTDVQSSRIGVDLFEGLVTFDAAGAIVPGVAERWDLSEDGRVYTFHLRADARWSDGSPVTATDFVVAWRRLLAPETRANYAFFLWPVLNGRAVSEGKLPPESLGAEAVDDRTLRVTLERPTGPFIAALTLWVTYPVSAANLAAHGDAFVRPGNMVSNGPYVLAEHVPQTFVRLEKNPHFREAASVAIDTVVHHHSESPETELRRFRAGELDIVQEAPVSQIDWLRANMPEAMVFYPVLGTRYLPVNMASGWLKDQPKLRQALYLAIDRQALVDKITRSGETPAWTFVPPNMPGYIAPIPEWARLTQAERNEMARRLAAEAGFGPGGKPIAVEILHGSSDNTRRTMVAVAAMWSQVLGAKVTLNNQEFKVVLSKIGAKDFAGVGELPWIADYPDAENFLGILRSDVGRINRPGYVNPAYDALMDQAANLLDPAARAAKLAEAEATMLADLPLIPLYHESNRNLVSPRVKGWIESPLGVQPSRFLSIAP